MRVKQTIMTYSHFNWKLVPHKRYVCIPIISTYDRSNAFYTVDSICCSKMTSIWRPTVVICQNMYRTMYIFCTCLNLLNNVVPGAFTNGFLIFVSNPQSYVLHIFTILSSDYIQAMSPSNKEKMKKKNLLETRGIFLQDPN